MREIRYYFAIYESLGAVLARLESHLAGFDAEVVSPTCRRFRRPDGMLEVREDVSFYDGHLSEVTFNFDRYDDASVAALFAEARALSELMTISYGKGFSAAVSGRSTPPNREESP